MISIIIPVLNESEHIVQLLRFLDTAGSANRIKEILVVDGGSLDDTLKKTADYSLKATIPIQAITSDKGRARQMNTGARNARGSILYFLHADSYPPRDFDKFILKHVKKGYDAGCFRMQFNSDHWWLRLMGWFTRFNWKACRGGDQSLFITKDLFWKIGGYDESFTIYEDQVLINALYKKCNFRVINKTLTTSARLYHEKGVWTLQYHFLVIYLKRWLGADADTLYAYYKKHIHQKKDKLTLVSDE